MKPGPKLMAAIFGAGIALISFSPIAAAHGGDPELRMLMNLDLFEKSDGRIDVGTSPKSDETMIDQIRALNAMGYLGDAPLTGAKSSSGGDSAPVDTHDQPAEEASPGAESNPIE